MAQSREKGLMIYEDNQSTRKELLKYITSIGTSLRIQANGDIDMLLKQVANAICEALHFRHSALYLSDNAGYFRVHATSGTTSEEEYYLKNNPLTNAVVDLLTQDEYRISSSYFIPTESSVWQDASVTELFVVPDADLPLPPADVPDRHLLWLPTDLLIVPLRSANNTMLGFLTPDGPFDGLRPNPETLEVLELFANQAAVIIEGAGLYEKARQVSEERGALIEIGRALFDPESLRSPQTVYQTIYEQVCRVMPTECFFISRYYQAEDELIIDFLIDEGVVHPIAKLDGIAPWQRKLLSKEQPGYLFSQAQEYEDFVRSHSLQPANRLIGSLHPSQSLIFVPIHHGDETIGLLSVQGYQPNMYTQQHVEILKEIAIQAGIAITNARMNAELRDAVEHARESERMKDHFLMTASHELRTPLTAIQGYLELLNMQWDLLEEERRRHFIRNAYHACDELILLLSNMMDASRMDQHWVTLTLSHVHVLDAIQRILEILEPVISRQERTIEVLVEDMLTVWADDLRLRQVLLNIVGNALKYTPQSAAITISGEEISRESLTRLLSHRPLLLSSSENFALVQIHDEGPGIAPEDQDRLFTRFVRLGNNQQSHVRGAGWGLYLCRQLVEAMGGHIWFESSGIPGEGTTFLIALPQSSGRVI